MEQVCNLINQSLDRMRSFTANIRQELPISPSESRLKSQMKYSMIYLQMIVNAAQNDFGNMFTFDEWPLPNDFSSRTTWEPWADLTMLSS